MKWEEFPEGDGFYSDDWRCAFAAADHHGVGPPKTIAVPIDCDDVLEVTDWWVERGDYAEIDMCAIMRLTKGRWATLEAYCDTTGWGCQDGGEISIGDDYQSIIYFGMGDQMRRRLNIPIPPYDPTDIRNSLFEIQTTVERLKDESDWPELVRRPEVT